MNIICKREIVLLFPKKVFGHVISVVSSLVKSTKDPTRSADASNFEFVDIRVVVNVLVVATTIVEAINGRTVHDAAARVAHVAKSLFFGRVDPMCLLAARGVGVFQEAVFGEDRFGHARTLLNVKTLEGATGAIQVFERLGIEDGHGTKVLMVKRAALLGLVPTAVHASESNSVGVFQHKDLKELLSDVLMERIDHLRVFGMCETHATQENLWIL